MGYLSGSRGYLAGPIEHGNAEINWRIPVLKELRERFKIDMFDPFSDPKQQWVPALERAREECDFKTMRKHARNFVTKDLSIVSRQDMVIAYLPYKVPTTGTVQEIIHSNWDKKPTMLVCDKGKQFIPFWYYAYIPLKMMFGSWEELYRYLDKADKGKFKNQRRWAYICKTI